MNSDDIKPQPGEDVWSSRRLTLAQQCCTILLMPFSDSRPVDLGIAQDCAQHLLRTDLTALSNNKVFRLLESSQRVVELLGDHSSTAFVDAAWDLNQQFVMACQQQPSRWQNEPWCVPATVVVDDSLVVVLDTKDWIYLSKPEGRHDFEALRSYASSGVRFPLSETAVEELLGGATEAQRQAILPTIEALGKV